MKYLRIPLALALLAGAALVPGLNMAARADTGAMVECPITHEMFKDSAAHKGYVVDGKRVAFCCSKCPAVFAANPEQHITAAMLGKCPVMGGPDHTSATDRVVINNQLQYFCCAGCDTQFKADPAKYVTTLTDVVSNKPFKVAEASPRSEYKGQVYLFSDAANKSAFDKTPEKYAVVFGPTKDAPAAK
ncbi:MAG TPA: hypothetical protein VFJ58_18765 [Armatimonadota bacterium]|nr:hypothetical protein [Armatimonadota bacterium]